MKLTNDTKERIRVFALFLLEVYKIMMGTFLSLFVPHNCPESDTECIAASNSPSMLSNVTIWTNSVTFFSICILYVIELMRENFFIHHLDIDPSVPDINLVQVAPKPVTILLNRWNRRYYFAALAGMIMTILNVILSSIFLLNHYRNTSTLTTLLSFTLLVFMKLHRSYTMSKKSQRETRAYSSYMTEYSSFNVLDKDVYPEIEVVDIQEANKINLIIESSKKDIVV